MGFNEWYCVVLFMLQLGCINYLLYCIYTILEEIKNQNEKQ